MSAGQLNRNVTAPCAEKPAPVGAVGRTGACRWWRRCVLESTLGLLRGPGPDVLLALTCRRSRLGIPRLWRVVPRCWPVPGCWMYSFAHPLTQQALFQGGPLLRTPSLEVGYAIRRSVLAFDGPVGATILTH